MRSIGQIPYQASHQVPYEDFVRCVVAELQRRGLFRKDFVGTHAGRSRAPDYHLASPTVKGLPSIKSGRW